MGCHQVVPFRTSRVADNNHQDMGRSRGGLTSKIHAVVDRNGLPVHLALTPGEAHDNRWCSVLLSALLPQTMLPADRGYDAHWIRVARLACRTPAKLRRPYFISSGWNVAFLAFKSAINSFVRSIVIRSFIESSILRYRSILWSISTHLSHIEITPFRTANRSKPSWIA
jgi:transposase